MRAAFSTAVLTLAMAAPLRADPGEHVSSLTDQQRVNVTIYNGSLALVHDVRKVSLQTGTNRLAWRDVSATMDATSAILSDLSTPGAANVVEQNFNFDLLKPSTVLDKYVGRAVVVVHPYPAKGEADREDATLLSDNEGLVLQYKDRVETGLQNNSYLVFPAIPADLRDRPTLVLDVASERAGDQALDLTYLTSGLSWSANYIGVVSPDEKHMDLTGLITLANTSGTTFRDAHMQLVAGNVNVAVPPPEAAPVESADSYQINRPPVTQENYFEYHLYTLGNTTTIGNNQTKQISLLTAHRVPIKKTLELRGDASYYTSADSDLGAKLAVGVFVTFTNKGGDLGVPLPGGVARLYKNDTRGTSQFLGSDNVDHTPRNEDVRLHLGDSFDVTASKKQTNFTQVTKCIDESTYSIVLKNGKTEGANVLVVEPIPGDWTITAENLRHVKSSSDTASWTVRVAGGGHTTLTYAARVKDC